MLDIRILREDPDLIARTLADRGVRLFDDLHADESDDASDSAWAQASVQRLGALDGAYLQLLQEAEELRHDANENSAQMKAVGKLPKDQQAAARTPLVEKGRELRERERSVAEQLETAAAQRDEAWSRVPNLTHPDTPRGHTDEDHNELRQVGARRDFASEGFEPKDHLQLAEALDLVDFESGAKVAGQKFYYLKNEAVLLELALQRYAIDIALRHGFTIYTTPDLARASILQGLGYNPRGESTQVYSVENSDLCLVGTAEITLGGLMADTIVPIEDLPLMVAGISHCFRTEAGSAGQESRGLYRVHQFTKVELFAFVEGVSEVSEAMHERFLSIEEEVFTGLGIPYRVLDIASGDLGGPAYRKYDLEAWMPGRGGWGEITSASNCTDYQARRLKIRYRPEAVDGKKQKARPVHMLNGTAVAISRALVAIFENYQQADGSILVPEALRTWVGCDRIGPR